MAASPARPKPTIVIVPGAWHPVSAFKKFSASLRSAGYDSVTVELATVGIRVPPVLTHRADVEAIHRVLRRLINQDGKQVIIFAHSAGGGWGSDAVRGFEATPGRLGGVVGVIFLAAFLVEAGEGTSQSINPNLDPNNLPPAPPGPNADGNMPVIRGEAGLEFQLLADNPAYIKAYRPYYWMYHDLPEEDAAILIVSLRPHSGMAFLSPTESAAWHHVPCTYIECSLDRTLDPNVRASMLEKVRAKSKYPWTVTTIDAAHSPFARYDRVEELTEIIDDHVNIILGRQT